MSKDEVYKVLEDVLLHRTKTKAFLKYLKASKPKDWKRVYGNIFLATEELSDKVERVTRYQIGVFDPNIHDCWPWHCHYEDGIYLSKKHRKCSYRSAAEFDSADDARVHFHNWKGKENYKMELIEYSTLSKK